MKLGTRVGRRTALAMVFLFMLSGCEYEQELSRDFWFYLVSNDVEGFRDWYDEAQLYMLENPATPNAAHFYKKLGMANIMFSSIKGGSNDFHWASSPHILETLKYATLAHNAAEDNDGFAERMALTYNELVMSVFLNNEPGVYEAIAAIENAANDPALAPFQKPVYYEVMGTLLLTAHDPALVEIGLQALEYSIALTNDCFTSDCNDARMLAPYYNVMNHLAAGEGAAMLGDYTKSAAHLAEAERLAVQDDWPYLDRSAHPAAQVRGGARGCPLHYPAP